MKIELHEITIREITENYIDNQENGVTGFNGLLNIRPKYQREFVYDKIKFMCKVKESICISY